MKISVKAFRGRIPRLSDKILPDSNATIARDCDLRSGEIRPFRGSTLVQALGSGQIDTIHRWFSGSNDYWLRFPGDVDVINAPLADDVYQRIYWTGDSRFNEPRMSYTPGIYTGGTDLPATTFKWGVPAPSNAPIVSVAAPTVLTISNFYAERPMRLRTSQPHGFEDGEVVAFNINAGTSDSEEVNLPEYLNGGEFQVRVIDDNEFSLDFTDAANVDYSAFTSGTVRSYTGPDVQDVRFYVYTYVTNLGEEGPPSPISDRVEATAFQNPDIELPAVDVDAAEGRIIEKVRIYRAATGTTAGQFQFVAEVNAGTANFTDDVRRLGESLPSAAYDPPPENLQGIRVSAQGFVVGFYDNVVCFSEPYLPHAWPTDYQIALDYDVVAVEVIDNGVVVATTGRPYLIQGIEPRSMSPRRLELNYACVSKRSMVSMGYAAVYASREGLVYVGQGGARLLTQQLMTERDWQAFYPDTLNGYEVNGRYVGFYGISNGAGFMLDPQDLELGLVDLSLWIKAGFRDPRDEHLYWLNGDNEVMRWNDEGADLQAYEWQSKVYELPRPSNLSGLKAVARDADTNLTHVELYADGVLRHIESLTSFGYSRLPADHRADEIQFRVSGTAKTQSVNLAESMEELRQ